MALALDLLRKLLEKLFFLRLLQGLLPRLLRGGRGGGFSSETVAGSAWLAVHFASADEFHRLPQVPVLQ
jgi:hypothetical protein